MHICAHTVSYPISVIDQKGKWKRVGKKVSKVNVHQTVCVHNTVSLQCSNFLRLSLTSIILYQGLVQDQPCTCRLDESFTHTFYSLESCQKFVLVIDNPCNSSWSVFPHQKFFITFIFDNDWVSLGFKRRRNQEGIRILEWRNSGSGKWWGELLLLFWILWVLLKVLSKSFTGFFFY